MSILVLDSVTSTMDAAKEMLKLDQVSIIGTTHTEPAGVMALDQTMGRGQRGRTWFSAPGESLCITYFLPLTDQEFREAGKIALLAGAAVANALDDMFSGNATGVATAGADDLNSSRFGLKWPNDLLMSGKKLGGILVETVQHVSKSMIALIGVGMNVGVERFPPDLEATCTSLAIEGLFPESLHQMASTIRDSLDRCMAVQLRYGFVATMANWRQYDKTTGRRFRTETANGSEIGTAIYVDAGGSLVVRADSGKLLTVLSASATSEM